MNTDRQKIVEAMAAKRNPELFSDNKRVAHMTASPHTVNAARQEARSEAAFYLDALIEHGPTEGMVEACNAGIWSAANDVGIYQQADLGAGLTAALAHLKAE